MGDLYDLGGGYAGTGFSLDIPPSTETTVAPARLVARTDKQAAASALGKPLPVVVGTGRVEGIYFIGGVSQVDTTTTTTTWTHQDITEIGGGIYAGQVIHTGAAGSGLGGPYSYPVYTRVDTSVTTSETTTKAGYVLAYDFWEAGYDLIRLEIDGKCIYDVELGIAATQTFRFYGGRHTSTDPILDLIIGENAGAYQNFVMLFLDGYPAESPPSVSAVISKGPTLSAMIIADFENGSYSYYGSARTFDDFFFRDDDNNYYGLEDAVVPGVGLSFASFSGAYQTGLGVTGEMLAKIIAGATVTWEIDVVPNPGVATNYEIDLHLDPDILIRSGKNAAHLENLDVIASWPSMPLNVGSNVIAWTFNASGPLSISVNGADAEVITGSYDPITNAGLSLYVQGWFNPGGAGTSPISTPTNLILKKMTARSPVPDAELADLSSGSSTFAATSAGSVSPMTMTTTGIDWVGSTPAVMDQDQAGRSAAYEPGSGVIYQVIPVGTALYLAVLDSYTCTERYRVPLEDTDGWSDDDRQVMCLRGAGHVLLRVKQAGVFQTNRIYDVANGHIVAEYDETIATDDYAWKVGQKFGDRYMLVGYDTKAGSTGVIYGLVDIAGQTLTTGHIGSLVPTAAGGLTYGISGPSSISFFFSTNAMVTELAFDGDDWSTRTVYTSAASSITATWFDPLTGYLVVIDTVSSTPTVHYINPVSGASIASYSIGASYYVHPSGANATGTERYWPKAGFVMLTRAASDDGRVSLLNISSHAISTFAEDTSVDNLEFNTGIFDQNRNVWITGINDDHWTVHMEGSFTPLLLDLDDVCTDVMSLAGFTSGDLTFIGMDGIRTYGFVIASDTTIQAAMRTLSDIYQFTWCDTGSGFVFKRPATGDLLTVDAAFAAPDIVERDQPVQSTDEADIRTPSSVEMDYVSKEGLYNPRPCSFSMTTGVLNSITTPRLSTPILLNDNEAQRICIEKFFEFQEKRRSHNLIVAPEFVEILPGDIVSFPSGTIQYIARIEQVGVDLRNMGVEISALDFQTEVETDVTSVTNTVAVSGTLFQTSQYVHLDMPLYRYGDDTDGASIVQYGVVAPRGQALWSGGELYRGPVVTALVKLFNQLPHAGVVGSCIDVLEAPADPFAADAVSTVTIRRLTFDDTLLVDATEDEVLAGVNNALIGEPGRWEWVGYENVTDNGDGTYTLSGFTFRGHRGSEVFCGLHEIGDVFVTLGPWVRKTLVPLANLGNRLFYKAVGIGQNIANVQAVGHIITGAAETPYAAVNLDAEEGTPDGIDISWDYRSRLMTGLNPVNIGEDTLEFEIDIYDTDGTTYLRTLTAATNSMHYAHADVLTDFGADPPPQLYFRVFMMSALPLLVPGQDRPVEGRGYEARGHVGLGGNELAAVTGQSLAVSVGAVTVVTPAGVAVTGQAVTVSVGTVTVSATSPVMVAVTGQSLTVSVGTVTVSAAGATDPSFANVVLLVGADGTDASTTILDESPIAHTLTAVGNAQIDTAQSKFGGSSALLDGVGDLVTAADSADWKLGSGAFTVEAWVRFNGSTGNDQAIVSHWENAGNKREWMLVWRGSQTPKVLDFAYSTAGITEVNIKTSAWTPTLGQWYHIAVDRSGNDFRIYVDGVMQVKTTAAVTLYASSTALLRVGAYFSSVNVAGLNGWIDELRVTKGVARYASDSGYTVPTAAFPRS